jgi:hypothetical protein
LGTDAFSYQVTDGFTIVSATVSISVLSDDPVASDDAYEAVV